MQCVSCFEKSWSNSDTAIRSDTTQIARTAGITAEFSFIGMAEFESLFVWASLFLSSLCILTDITRVVPASSWTPPYTRRPAVTDSARLKLDASLAWGDGKVLASLPRLIPLFHLHRTIIAIHQVLFCEWASHLTRDGRGRCLVTVCPSRKILPAPRCPSGAACTSPGGSRCAKAGACDLGDWTPCRHSASCFSLPPAWPLDAPDFCPTSCPPGSVPSSELILVQLRARPSVPCVPFGVYRLSADTTGRLFHICLPFSVTSLGPSLQRKTD